MSDALTPTAPEPNAAVVSVETPAPVEGTAVAVGSAGEAPAVVDATRFNGLMSAHQKALDELAAERRARAELEARITSQETTTVADEQALDEVRSLREELKAERLEAARQKALADFPDAAPLADLIVGNTAEEIRSVAQAVAQRLAAMKAPAVETPVVDAATAPAVETPAAPAAPVAPVISGGTVAPVTPSSPEAARDALKKGDWSAWWSAKLSPASQVNLG